MCQEFSAHYRPCDAAVPARARAFAIAGLSEALTGPGVDELGELVAVVVSELVTNAAQAGCSQVRVGLDVHRSHVKVVVEDDAPGWPQLGAADARDVHGRGISIVSAVARDWGVQQIPAGKQVWAELVVTARFADGFVCRL